MIKIGIIVRNIIVRKFVLIILLAPSLVASASSMNEIKIAGGALTGTYYPAALQLCNLISKYSPITKCEVVASSGSINNLSLLSTNKVDFAFVQSDLAKDSLKSAGVFTNQKPYDNLRLVLSLFPEVFTIIVKDEKGISNFSDLSGKTLGINLKGSGVKTGLVNVLRYYKFEQEPKVVNVSEAQMPSKLCDDEVDVIILFSGLPSPISSKITSTCNTEFVTIDPLKLEKMLLENPVYERSVIPASMHKDISRDASTFSTRALLVTNAETQKEKVELIDKTVRRYFDEFKALYPVLNNLDKEETFTKDLITRY